MDINILEKDKNDIKLMYDNFGYDTQIEREFIIKHSLPLSGNILEIGTGKGNFTIELAKHKIEFTTIDISLEHQNLVLAKLKDLELEKYVTCQIDDAENLSFANELFDIIFSINAVHHIKNMDSFMDEIRRVMKKDGKIILSDFTEAGFSMLDMIFKEEGKTHDRGKVTMIDIETYLIEKGFNIIKAKTKFQDIIIAQNS